MDIKSPKKRFDDQLTRALRGQPVDHADLLQEEIEILHMVSAIKQAEPQVEPAEVFHQNLRKRLLNTHELMQNPARAHVTGEAGNLLTAGNEALLSPPRRWAWAVAPIAAIAVLAAYVSFAAASPGFYEKYVPEPVKKALEDTKVIQTGSLSVASDPDGAMVLLNSQEQGATPIEVGGIRVGKHQVAVKRAGFQEERREIEIKSNELTKLEIVLAPIPNNAQPTPTPTPVPTQTPGEVTNQIAQVVLLQPSAESTTLSVGSVAGATAAPIFTITPAAEQVVVADAGEIFFSQKSAVGTAIYRLSPTGERQKIITSATGLAENFIVSPDGAALSYVTAERGTYEVHFVKIGGADQVINASDEAGWVPIGFRDGAVVVAQTALDRRTVKRIAAIQSAKKPVEWTLPAGTNILLDSQTAYHHADGAILLQNGEKIVAAQAKPDQPRDVSLDSVIGAAWAGERAMLTSGMKIQLKNINDGKTQEVYRAPEGATIRKAVSDRDGKIIAVWLTDTRVDLIAVTDQKARTITSDKPLSDCLKVVGPATFTASDKVIDIVEPESDRAISLLGELNLSAAKSETMALMNNNIVRASDGEKSLEVVSLADSTKPQVIGALPKSAFSGDMMIAVSGRYAVITGGQLQFVDLQNSRAPRVIKTEAVPAVGAAVSGERAYVLAGGNLLVYELTGTSPRQIGGMKIGITQALAMTVKGNRLFIAAGDEGLVVVDLTDSTALEVVKHAREHFVRAVAATEKYVYVFSGTPGGDGLAEAWDTQTLAKVKTIAPSFASGQVYSDGRYLYATAPKLAVYEPLADGAVRVVAEAAESETPASVTQILALDDKLVTLSGGKLMVYQVRK